MVLSVFPSFFFRWWARRGKEEDKNKNLGKSSKNRFFRRQMICFHNLEES